MPLAYCAGTCGRMISISNIPGGNPEALAHPESFAIDYTECGRCRKLWCERCAGAACTCGTRLAVMSRESKLERFDPGSRALIRISELRLPLAEPVSGGAGQPQFLAAPPVDPQVAQKRDLFERARSCAARAAVPEAIAALDQAIALDATFSEALAMRGWLHQLSRNNDQARADFTAALRHASPTWPYRTAIAQELAS